MEAFLPIIQHAPLFQGVTLTDIQQLLPQMAVQRKKYRKGQFVFCVGDDMDHISIVLSGLVHILQEDYWGNRNILTQVTPGGMFGEAFACLPDSISTVDVLAVEDTELMEIHVSAILHAGTVLSAAQEQLTMNLLAMLARRNKELTEKIRYMSQRSTRQKLMFYLSAEARRQGTTTFTLPYNRQQLADFLSVDRSAMSAELSKMQKEGLISYSRNEFTLREKVDRE